MARHPRGVDEAIARFDEVVGRYDGAGSARASRTRRSRAVRSAGRRITRMAAALGALIVAAMAYGLFVAPLQLTGLFVLLVLTIAILLFFGLKPEAAPRRREYSEAMPTKQVVQQLGSYLGHQRAALPAPAARRLDAISEQLPLLESRLGQVDALDPLAQDARRLMGKHLPELIDRYERVPAAYRQERDGEGLTVDERLVAGLDAARTALDDIGARLAQGDLDAFATQGRFIESRYKDGAILKGD